MIAPARTQHAQAIEPQHHDRFLEMLPRIRFQASKAFRQLRPELKEELTEEVIANAFCAFVRLVGRGKLELAYATPLANFAIRQVLDGRQVGTKPNRKDVMAPYARAAGRVFVERLDRFDDAHGAWRQVLIEDRHATPADVAAARIDVAEWLRSLPVRNQRIANTLAMGETTSETALQFESRQDPPTLRDIPIKLGELSDGRSRRAAG